MYAANRHLRGLVYGGLVHPQCVIGTGLASLLFRRKNRGLMWDPRPAKGIILHSINKWFSDCGATNIGSWLWSPGPLPTVVDLGVSYEGLALSFTGSVNFGSIVFGMLSKKVPAMKSPKWLTFRMPSF